MRAVEEIVDRMLTFVPDENPTGMLGSVTDGFAPDENPMGVLTITGPLNARTGEAKIISLICCRTKVEGFRAWFIDFFTALGDDTAREFSLRKPMTSQLAMKKSVYLDPDDVMEHLLFSIPRG